MEGAVRTGRAAAAAALGERAQTGGPHSGAGRTAATASSTSDSAVFSRSSGRSGAS